MDIPQAGGDEEPALSDTDEGSTNTGVVASQSQQVSAYIFLVKLFFNMIFYILLLLSLLLKLPQELFIL